MTAQNLATANAAQHAVEAATEPGGVLRLILEELVHGAACIALEAAGVPVGDPLALTLNDANLEDHTRWTVAESLQRLIVNDEATWPAPAIPEPEPEPELEDPMSPAERAHWTAFEAELQAIHEAHAAEWTEIRRLTESIRHVPAAMPLPWQPTGIRRAGFVAYRAELPGGPLEAAPRVHQACQQQGPDGRCDVCRSWQPLWILTTPGGPSDG